MPDDTDLIVRSHVLAAEPLTMAWEITSRDLMRVEMEILRLQMHAGIAASEFYRPWRRWIAGVRYWRATGYTLIEPDKED